MSSLTAGRLKMIILRSPLFLKNIAHVIKRRYSKGMIRCRITLVMVLGALLILQSASYVLAKPCNPTEPDIMGPFYKPGAPERSSVGKGYILSGMVRSFKDCLPIEDAKIEFWLTGPDGHYDDKHRASVYTDSSGMYGFESNFPVNYGGRPAHIHIRVSAEGFRPLVTQHYPQQGTSRYSYDLILIPED